MPKKSTNIAFAGLPGENFAYGEYTHTLRLASELADLRAGYANSLPLRFACGAGSFRVGSKKTPARRGKGLFGTHNRN